MWCNTYLKTQTQEFQFDFPHFSIYVLIESPEKANYLKLSFSIKLIQLMQRHAIQQIDTLSMVFFQGLKVDLTLKVAALYVVVL